MADCRGGLYLLLSFKYYKNLPFCFNDVYIITIINLPTFADYTLPTNSTIGTTTIPPKRICTSKSTTEIDFPVVGDLLLAPPLRLPHPDQDEAVTLSSPYGPVYVRVWYSLLPLLPLTVSCDINRVTIGYRLGNDWRSIESTEINHRI